MAAISTCFPSLQVLQREPLTLMVHGEDSDLVAAVLSGDDSAFRPLMQRYTPLISAYLRGKTRDAHELEDVMQEVFLEAYRGLGTLRDRARLGPWLLGISRHKVADSHRALVRRQESSIRGPEEEGASQLIDSTADASEMLQRQQDGEALERALNLLDDKHRVVIGLRSMEGKSFPEIARMLAISESAAKMRFKRGLVKLRKSLVSQGIATTWSTQREDI